jgi:hypothetical protein
VAEALAKQVNETKIVQKKMATDFVFILGGGGNCEMGFQ